MKALSDEQRAYAIGRLMIAMDARGFKQQDLHDRTGVAQSTISRILSPSANDRYEPSEDTLRKLFKGLGLNFDEIVGEIETMPKRITGYLASPLTSVVGDSVSEANLNRFVNEVRTIVCSDLFPEPRFDLYWPGDHTHPVRNKDFTAAQVYLTDRSQASSFDFVILICASPSYGVGQENEIITQAGLPAIRMVPHVGLSRMMKGSFLQSNDIKYSGDLAAGAEFSKEDLAKALLNIRTIVFNHRALYKGMQWDDFRSRLRDLIQDRCGNNTTFGNQLGVDIRYVEALLQEPLTVSNPSAQLLKRMSVILHVSVGFLLGETEETDPVWVESMATWHEWARNSKGLDGALVVAVRDEWREELRENRKLESSPISPRRRRPGDGNLRRGMSVDDWNARYQKRMPKTKRQVAQDGLF
jgi:transcriptional regulator with XRE-family HTH domain